MTLFHEGSGTICCTVLVAKVKRSVGERSARACLPLLRLKAFLFVSRLCLVLLLPGTSFRLSVGMCACE
jgi:hypothetical protein